jgi:hypothetical protein
MTIERGMAEAVRISRAEGYDGLSLKCVDGLKIWWQNYVL